MFNYFKSILPSISKIRKRLNIYFYPDVFNNIKGESPMQRFDTSWPKSSTLAFSGRTSFTPLQTLNEFFNEYYIFFNNINTK